MHSLLDTCKCQVSLWRPWHQIHRGLSALALGGLFPVCVVVFVMGSLSFLVVSSDELAFLVGGLWPLLLRVGGH